MVNNPSVIQILKHQIVPDGSMLLLFLGQAGYLVKAGETIFLIDPYLSNYIEEAELDSASVFKREFPAPLLAEELLDVDYIFVTHDHADHCDPISLPIILRNNPDCKLIGSQLAIERIRTLGVPDSQFLTCKANASQELSDLKYWCVPCAHYKLEISYDGYSAYTGFVITTNDVTLYHAGDTILYPGMTEGIRAIKKRIHVACLPVNGRDSQRDAMGIVGNMSPAEALSLTMDLGADVMLPMHNDLFKINRSDPAKLMTERETHCPRKKIHWLQPGELFYYIVR